MTALKAIRGKIRATDKTRKVTRAMEAVSAVKMRKAQGTALAGRPYARAALSILERVSGSYDVRRHPLVVPRDVGKVLMFLITSDKGLAGNLNSGVLRAMNAELALRGWGPANTAFVCIGRRGKEHVERRGFPVLEYHENRDDNVRTDHMRSVVNTIVSRYAEGAFDAVFVAYMRFASTFEQRPTFRQMLPLSVEEVRKVVHDIRPERGLFAAAPRGNGRISAPYILEPNAEEVFATLLPDLLAIEAYHALLESKASEHSARMVAMKSATDKALERVREFTLDFNKARQAVITREVSEITGGIEAMAS